MTRYCIFLKMLTFSRYYHKQVYYPLKTVSFRVFFKVVETRYQAIK
jgi:hypothetical protein